jgi:hypothetical protein
MCELPETFEEFVNVIWSYVDKSACPGWVNEWLRNALREESINFHLDYALPYERLDSELSLPPERDVTLSALLNLGVFLPACVVEGASSATMTWVSRLNSFVTRTSSSWICPMLRFGYGDLKVRTFQENPSSSDSHLDEMCSTMNSMVNEFTTKRDGASPMSLARTLLQYQISRLRTIIPSQTATDAEWVRQHPMQSDASFAAAKEFGSWRWETRYNVLRAFMLASTVAEATIARFLHEQGARQGLAFVGRL